MEAAKTVADVVPDKSNKTVTLRIKEAVLFDVDKSALECNSKETLSKVIGFLTYQVRVPHTEIQILGHTDITGTDAHDDALSDARATAVKRYFTSAGIPEEIITAREWGNANLQALQNHNCPRSSAISIGCPSSGRRTEELK